VSGDHRCLLPTIGVHFGFDASAGLFQSGQSRLRHAPFIGIFFDINRRWLFRFGEPRLRRAALFGISFAINRRNMLGDLVVTRSQVLVRARLRNAS
jgi:hypothetical protein